MVEKQIVAQPLQGKRILVTRTRDQASVFCEQLRELGAIPVEFPTIRIVPPQDWTQLDAALGRLYSTDAPDMIGSSLPAPMASTFVLTVCVRLAIIHKR